MYFIPGYFNQWQCRPFQVITYIFQAFISFPSIVNRWITDLYTRAALVVEVVELRQMWRYNPPAVLAVR